MIISTMLKPPLLELVVEIRFISTEPDNLIVGILEKLAKKYSYTNILNLGMAQIPEQIRNNDQNLANAPWYRIAHATNTHLSCFVGPKVFSLSWSKQPNLINQEPFFPGWTHAVKDDFIAIISEVIDQQINIDLTFESVMYRTIDIFEEDKILRNTNFSLSLNDINLSDSKMNTNMAFKISEGALTHTIAISNSSQFSQNHPNNLPLFGKASNIDIITNYFLKNGDIKEDLISAIDICHDENKKVFSSIIKKEFAENELGATYASN